MSVLCRWMVDIASKNWALVGGRPKPTFMQMPLDVFVNICEWLSVRDILALRMSNKFIAGVTQQSIIWNSLLRRLMVPLPVLPATSKYRFGEIKPQTYEWLMVRALYLERNWRRQNPIASASRFEAFDQTIIMKMLPGGKYMVSVLKNLASGHYSLVLWDLDHAGRRVALIGAKSSTPFLKLEAKYGVINDMISIVIAFAQPPMEKEEETSTTVIVLAVPIQILEELATYQPDSKLFQSFAKIMEFPFSVIHQSSTSCDVGQLALADYGGEMILAVVHRPRALVFHYLNAERRGNLLLGPIYPYHHLLHSIWTIKLLPSQNAVLVSRVLVEVGMPQDSTLFALDIFQLPGPGSTYKKPTPVDRQLISGLHADGFYFSNLEETWITGLRDLEALMPAPVNNQPPPISIFITTRQPRGLVHCIMRPVPIDNVFVRLPWKRGFLRRYGYELPAVRVERQVWTDQYSRPVVIPGAYRSVVVMRPHVGPDLREEGSAVEVLRFCTHVTLAEGYNSFSTPGSTGNIRTSRAEEEGGAVEVEEQTMSEAVVLQGKRINALRVPMIPNSIAWEMMEGTTAIAFDESVGRMCVATNDSTGIHVLDFGGTSWELAVVKT